jgi:hypothetical protein
MSRTICFLLASVRTSLYFEAGWIWADNDTMTSTKFLTSIMKIQFSFLINKINSIHSTIPPRTERTYNFQSQYHQFTPKNYFSYICVKNFDQSLQGYFRNKSTKSRCRSKYIVVREKRRLSSWECTEQQWRNLRCRSWNVRKIVEGYQVLQRNLTSCGREIEYKKKTFIMKRAFLDNRLHKLQDLRLNKN